MSVEHFRVIPVHLKAKASQTGYSCCRAACASSGAGIGILKTKGQALVFARPRFELCRSFASSGAGIGTLQKTKVKLWFLQDRALNFALEFMVARARSMLCDCDVAGFMSLGGESFESNGAGIGTPQTKGQALVFARPGFEFCGRCSSASAVQLLAIRSESMCLTSSTVCKELHRQSLLLQDQALNFAGVAGVQFWCIFREFMIVNFDSLQRTQCPLE
eukprot:s2941_g5.t1